MERSNPHVTRLRQAHAQAIFEVKNQIQHWENVKKEYNDLSSRLATLPDKVTHDVMVPFGPLAFMPGKLIHTNELLVHLGDSWFADVSCKKGIRIADHRLETVNKNIDDLNKTLKNLEKKSDFAEELNNTGGGSAFEITEEVPEGYVHPSRRKRISRVKPEPTASDERQNVPDSVHDENAAASSCLNDKELMRRLDELEEMEEEEDQLLLNSSSSSSEECNQSSHADDKQKSTSETKKFNKKKRVSWGDELKFSQGREADSDDSDENFPPTIKFKHTSSLSQDKIGSGDKSSVTMKSKTEAGVVQSPADIGRLQHLHKTVDESGDWGREGNQKIVPTENPKSILKINENIDDSNISEDIDFAAPVQVALEETVFEHRDQLPTTSNTEAAPKKRISRFKASRMK